VLERHGVTRLIKTAMVVATAGKRREIRFLCVLVVTLLPMLAGFMWHALQLDGMLLPFVWAACCNPILRKIDGPRIVPPIQDLTTTKIYMTIKVY
jgi:hypothetical protein